jgi:hypothetical protein
VNWLVVVPLLLVFVALGALIGTTRTRHWTWPLSVLGFAAAGLLFIPVRCATGDVATPFGGAGTERPTSCEGLAGAVLPELGPFAGDTVGYGLAIVAVALSLWTAGLVARTRSAEEPQQ